jgi:hypothetical protein
MRKPFDLWAEGLVQEAVGATGFEPLAILTGILRLGR